MPPKLTHLLLATVEDREVFEPLRLALERRVERVTVFRPAAPKLPPMERARRWLRIGSSCPPGMTVPALRQYAEELRLEAVRVQPQAVLSVGSPCVAYLERREVERPAALRVPVFLFQDVPWLTRLRAYERWQPISRWGARFAAEEARAARQLDGLCFASAWACDEALRLYSQSGTRRDLILTERLHAVPWGATNVPALGRVELLEHRSEQAGGEVLELLFLCPDEERGWERAGGMLAVEIARQIHLTGRRVRLHIAGSLSSLRLPESMTGFLVLHGAETAVEGLLIDAHLLLAPAQAECRGASVLYAQAFALPCVARGVDVLPSLVEDGVGGLLLPEGARASLYVERILALWDDPAAYLAMAGRSRARFEQEANWDRCAERVVAAIEAGM